MDVDDYLDDDFILDDALLESLDACEAKFNAQSNLKRPRSQLTDEILQSIPTSTPIHTPNPSAKRARFHSAANVNDPPASSSPPEIIVTKDGQYQLTTCL
jgi:hypothetical protein